jgi:hypothetical protein
VRPALTRAALALGLLLVSAGAVQAAAADPRGIAVSPAYQQISLGVNDPGVDFTLQLTNYTAVGQSFTLSTADFGSLNEQGGVAFLGQSAQSVTDRYRLSSWMKLEKDQLFLAPGQSGEVRVTVTNRDALAPGGHYGAVLATAQTEGQAGQSQVGVKQVVSSLVLLSKQGGGLYDLRLDWQHGNGHIWQLPTEIEHRFQNTGNVHVVPRGLVEVRDPVGRLVERGALNENSGFILPESFRRYPTALTRIGTAMLPGRYEVKTTYRYDGLQSTKTLVTHVWYAGQLAVWLIMLVTLAAIGLLGWWLWRRRRA